MRVIAGNLGGRQFAAPHGRRTHPMSDKMRGGLFNTLGDIDGLSMLDAFAGSGALSIEAISRGAAHITAIDIDRRAVDVINQNAKTLKIKSNQLKIIRANASSWSDNNPGVVFDIVFSAPPYDDLQEPLVEKLARHTGPSGLYVLDWPSKRAAPQLDGLKLIESKPYGDAQAVFYRRTS